MNAPPALCASTALRRTARALWTHSGSQVFFFDTHDGVYFATEATGTRLWELLAQPQTPASLYQTLSAEYDLDALTWQQDGLGFLQDALAAGLLETVSGEELR